MKISHYVLQKAVKKWFLQTHPPTLKPKHVLAERALLLPEQVLCVLEHVNLHKV